MESKTLAELADELVLTATMIRQRVGEDGKTILGWRGFHLDVDRAADIIEELPLKARGIPRS